MRATFTKLICISFFSLLGLYPAEGFSQMADIAAELSWGSEQKAPAGSRMAKIIHSGTWGACIFRYRPGKGFNKDDYWLEYYDQRFAFQGRYELDIPTKPRADVEDIVFHKGQLYLLMSRPAATPEEEISELIVRPLSPQGQVIREEQLIAEIPLEEKYRRRQFDLTYSRDSSYILLYNQLPFEREGPERFSLRVLDENFKMLWNLDEQLNYRDLGFNVEEYQIDKRGNVYLLGSYREEEGNRRAPPIYHLFTYHNDGKEVMEYILEIDGIGLRQMTFRLDRNGEIVCAGFFTMPGEKTVAGLCHVRINPQTRQVIDTQIAPFEDRTGMVNFRTKDLILRTDGGWVLTAEQYVRYRPNYNSPMAPAPEIFRNDDIMVANVNPDGTFAWLRQIPKYQEDLEMGGFYSSFVQGTTPDGFYFLYNEHPKNFSPDRKKVYSFNNQESIIALTNVNRAGEVVTNPLFLTEDIGLIALPRRCRQIGSRLMLVYAENGRKYRLGLLRVE